MATSIGTVSCDFLRGNPPPPRLGNVVIVSRRPGVQGLVAEKLPSRGGPFALRAVKIASSANVTAWLADLDALRGAAAVTVETDDGEQYSDCYITALTLVSNRACVHSGATQRECVVMVYGERSA